MLWFTYCHPSEAVTSNDEVESGQRMSAKESESRMGPHAATGYGRSLVALKRVPETLPFSQSN